MIGDVCNRDQEMEFQYNMHERRHTKNYVAAALSVRLEGVLTM